MDYYKLRTRVFNQTSSWLETAFEAKKAGHHPPLYKDFRRRMMLNYGITDKMLVKAIASLTDAVEIKNDELVFL